MPGAFSERSSASAALPVLPFAIGIWALASGHRVRGAMFLTLALVIGVTTALGVPWPRWTARAGSALASVAVGAISILAGLAFTLAWSIAQVGRRDILRGGSARRRPPQWTPLPTIDAAATAHRQFVLERDAPDGRGRVPVGRAVVRGLTLSVGVVAVLAAVDLTAGWAWNRWSPAPTDSITVQWAGTAARDSRNPLADSPAMAASPWAEQLFRETDASRVEYSPFTEIRFTDQTGRHVNVRDGRRRTYRPSGIGESDAPEVWFFGGSTMWGIGQRDGHTIPSEIARAAEAAGTPIVAVNYGQRSWTHFQEMLLFEREVARHGPPDLVVFYDGVNDVNAQEVGRPGVPNHMYTRQFEELVRDGRVSARPGSFVAAMTDAYARSSATGRLLRAWRDDPATTAEAPSPDDPELGADSIRLDDLTRLADGVVDVYERGRRLSVAVADEHGVQPFFFWQPQSQGGPVREWVRRELSRPTVDIGDALDGHEDTYLDGRHTNEDGARIVAMRIWEEIAPAVRQDADAPRAMPPTSAPAPTTDRPGGSTTTAPAADAATGSALAALATARSELDASRGDVCRLSTWIERVAFDDLDEPALVGAVLSLISDFAIAVADAAPPTEADAADALRNASGQLLEFAAANPRPSVWDFLRDGPIAAPATQEAFSSLVAACD